MSPTVDNETILIDRQAKYNRVWCEAPLVAYRSGAEGVTASIPCNLYQDGVKSRNEIKI